MKLYKIFLGNFASAFTPQIQSQCFFIQSFEDVQLKSNFSKWTEL